MTHKRCASDTQLAVSLSMGHRSKLIMGPMHAGANLPTMSIENVHLPIRADCSGVAFEFGCWACIRLNEA